MSSSVCATRSTSSRGSFASTGTWTLPWALLTLSFSIGMQIGVTAVNAVIGVAAVMLLSRTLHPFRAVRAGLRVRS